MKINRTCETCESNAGDMCIGADEYSEKKVKDNFSCDNWGCSLDYFQELLENLPEDLQEKANGPFCIEILEKHYKCKL